MTCFVGPGRSRRYPTSRRDQPAPVPFDQRERRHVARALRRLRLNEFVGTLMLLILFVCGACALTFVAKLSADPSIIRPW